MMREGSAIESDAACRTRETLEALRGLLSSLAGASTPPTMIFFSAGISATTRTTGNLGTSNCDLSTDAFQNVGTAAAEARAHVYVVQADLTPAQRSDGLENLAGVTGAQVMVLAAAGENALNRIALETSASYLGVLRARSHRNATASRIASRCASRGRTSRCAPGRRSRSPAPTPGTRARAREPARHAARGDGVPGLAASCRRRSPRATPPTS